MNLKVRTGTPTELVQNTDLLIIAILIELLFVGYR